MAENSIQHVIHDGARLFHDRLQRIDTSDLLEVDIEAQIEALPHSTLERAMVYLREIKYLYDVQHYEYMVRFIKAHQDWTLSDLFEFLNV